MKLLDALKSGKRFRVKSELPLAPWFTELVYNESENFLVLRNEYGNRQVIEPLDFHIDHWEIEPEFKVGDRVKVPEQFGIIEEGEDSDGNVYVRFDTKEWDGDYFRPSDLIKIPEDKT